MLAEILNDTPGALWNQGIIDAARVSIVPELSRVVVAIDPATTTGDEADETGIVVVGKDANDHGYVLADCSGRYSPIEWAKIAIAAYRTHHADRIVAETNNGGEMVESTLRMVDNNVAFSAVHASRGKVTRAEPVSALYEQARMHHAGSFAQLEDQMCAFTSDFDRDAAGYSPDRVDALVWATTELLIEPMKGFAIYELYRRQAEALLSHHTGPTELTYEEKRDAAIRAERARYAAIVAERLPTGEEVAHHTDVIDKIIRGQHAT